MGRFAGFVIFFWVSLLAPALAGSWSRGAPLQTGRAGLGAAVSNGRIYAVGGAGILAPLGDCEVYRSGGGGWRTDTDLPVGLESFGLAALNGKLYAAGGYAADSDASPSARMWVYDPVSSEWVQGPSMPEPRAAFALIAAQGKLYAFGGTGPKAGQIFVFDPRENAWSTLQQGLSNSRDLAGAVVDGHIYLIGGGPAANPLATVNIYDLADGTWAQGPALPVARSGHAVTVINGDIHVLGGRGGGRGETLTDHWVLDHASGKWRQEEPLPTPRTGAAAVTLDGAVYLVGGGSGGGFFAPFTAIAATDIWHPDSGR